MNPFNKNENKNNILFIGMYALFLIFAFYFSESANEILMISTVLIVPTFLLLGATIYGLFSKNPEKSYLFGFLVPIVIELGNSIYAFIHYSVPLFSEFDLLKVLFFALIWGVPGYFAAKKSTDKRVSIIYLLIVIVFVVIQMVLTG